MTKLSTVKMTLQKLLLKFGEKSTDKGLISYVGDEPEVGMEVYLNDEVAPDGDYEVADSNMVIRVAEGKIAEIIVKEEAPAEEVIEAEEEVPAPEEAPAEEVVPAEEVDVKAVLVEILQPVTEKMAEYETRIEALEARLQEIETKLLEAQAKPADEEIQSVEVIPETGYFRNTRK